MSLRFVHLHLHTEFSLADSTIRVPEKPDYARPEKAGDRPNLLSRAIELQLPALAVTGMTWVRPALRMANWLRAPMTNTGTEMTTRVDTVTR